MLRTMNLLIDYLSDDIHEISIDIMWELTAKVIKNREKNAKQLMRKVKKENWAKDLVADGTEGRRWT